VATEDRNFDASRAVKRRGLSRRDMIKASAVAGAARLDRTGHHRLVGEPGGRRLGLRAPTG
jgi:hypothetical protein